VSKVNWKWKESEAARAIRAAQKAGLTNFTVRIKPGNEIAIEARQPDAEPPANEWDA
jgi:hypothetical protein